MGILVVTPEVRSRIAEIVEYAEAHPFAIGVSPRPPGDDPHYVLHSGSYRIVFSITWSDGQAFRHLSISCALARGLLPNPAVVTEIAHLFGFTGGLRDWFAHVETDGPVPFAVIAQTREYR